VSIHKNGNWVMENMLAADQGETSVASGDATDGIVRAALIQNQRGLHARAAAKFVKVAAEFKADVVVRNRGQEVSAHSIMGLMMLAASKGTTIELEAKGNDALRALDAIEALINDKFHEE
jgi:phosphocarrier protein